jgi:DNA-binding transcriptional LysR family regulator
MAVSPETIRRHLSTRLKFKHLTLLITVGEQCNIFKAAQLLNMAQPAATKTIRDLENALDLPLFDRSSRGVTPTPYGEVIIRHAKLILAQVKHAAEELASIRDGLSGHVTIGTLLAASPALLPHSLAKLKRERPNITVSVIEGTNAQLLPGVLTGDIDMVVGRLPEVQDEEAVRSEILYREPVAIVARTGHPLAKKKKLTLADLVEAQWILPSPGTTLRREIDSAFHRAGLPVPRSVIESVSILTNRALLVDTDMIAAMPYQVIRAYEEMGLLCQLPIRLQTDAGPVGVTLRAGAQLTPAASYLLEVLRETGKAIDKQQPKIA